MPIILKSYLLQLALCDEWYRVFILEKRVGLGIVVGSIYALGKISFEVHSIH